MTERDRRLLTFLLGDLLDASKAINFALVSDYLSPLERERLQKVASTLKTITRTKERELKS